ncbi:hypothetical protein PTKIN_Ptkin09bG0110200 [Pterospermum kingtungense]
MLFLCFLLAFPLFLIFLLKQRNNGENLLPPGPPGLPLLGNIHEFYCSNPHVSLWRLSQKYGPLMSLRLGSKPTIIVSSAKMAEEIMRIHELDFCSRPPLRSLQKYSYNGFDIAFAPFNAYWREIKKISFAYLFHPNKVKLYRSIREFEVSKIIERISKFSVASEPINLSEEVMRLTSTIICRVGLGKREGNEGSAKDSHRLTYETHTMFGSFFFSDCFPSLGWLDKFTGKLGRLEKNFKEFDDFYQEVIEEHLDPKRPKPEHEDIVDALLQKDRVATIDLTFDQIKAVLMNVFLGGTDASSATVIWAMTSLMKNPSSMMKAQEEVRNLIGNKGFVDEDDIQNLLYLKAVVKETFRFQPPLPLLVARETIKNCKLGEYEIPAKTRVYVNAWAIGRNPESWENPEKFNPGRFLSGPIDYKELEFDLIPFGGGRRRCPGNYMGTLTSELVLANLLYKFDWEMPVGMNKEDLDFDTSPGVTMHKKNALCLMARQIN